MMLKKTQIYHLNFKFIAYMYLKSMVGSEYNKKNIHSIMGEWKNVSKGCSFYCSEP